MADLRTRRFALSLMLASAMSAGPGVAQSPDPIDAHFARWAGGDGPGCAVGVDRPGAAPIRRAWGLAELEHAVPAGPDTIYEAGSVSKQFTAAAVVLLADDGVLGLDDDVRRWIPELPDHGVPITIRQMLNHTSGLRDWGAVADIEGWPRGSRDVDNAGVVRIVARQTALNYAPGTEWLYSNSGYNLAAVVVERASGQTLAEFTRTRLFEPLGMTRTSWRDDHARIVPGRADAYSAGARGWRRAMPFEDAYGNGGLLTTVGDLLIWNRALTEDRIPGLAGQLAEPGRIGDRPTKYGLGLFHGQVSGQDEIGHSGATGGYRGWLARYPGTGLSVAVLCNAGDADGQALGRAVAADLLPPGPPTPAPLADDGRNPVGLFADAVTEQPMVLIVRPDGVLVTQGRSLPRVASGVFAVGDDRLEVIDADAFTRVSSHGDRARYERRLPVQPDAAALNAYAGTWRSDDAPATLILTVADGRLILTRDGQSLALNPSHADVFMGPPGVVRFRRDAEGGVVSMHINNGRVRDMSFRRLN